MGMTGRSHRRTLSAAMAVLLATLAWTPLRAQGWAVPAVGERVRIAWPVVAPKPLRGELVAVRGDTLVVRRDVSLQLLEVPLSEVDWVEVRRPRSQLEGLGHGLLVGVPAGFGAATCSA